MDRRHRHPCPSAASFREQSGLHLKNKFGDKVVSANPKVKMMNDALKQAQAILKEFGATQKESRKLGKAKPVPKSDLDNWLEKNNGDQG